MSRAPGGGRAGVGNVGAMNRGTPAPDVGVGSPESGPGAAQEGSTEPIGEEDQEKGQTGHLPPDDDVGT
jgi:hypothetical protein